jgi:hypothetical protein
MAYTFSKKRFGLLTLHGKEKVIAPLLAKHLSAKQEFCDYCNP